jgi:hypothetical protein
LYLLIPPHIRVDDFKNSWNGYTFSLFHPLLFTLLLLVLTTYSLDLRIVIGFSHYYHLRHAWDTLSFSRVWSFAWTVFIPMLHLLLFIMSFTISSWLYLSGPDFFRGGRYVPPRYGNGVLHQDDWFISCGRDSESGIMRAQCTPAPRLAEEVRAMGREDKLVIRLSTAERAAIDRLAQAERLPAATLARRMLLCEIDRRGLWPPQADGQSPAAISPSHQHRLA